MLSEKKKNDILAFVWLVAAGLLFLCLISYDPDDIAFHTSTPNEPVRNFVGIAGAYLSWIMALAIGKGAYFLSLLMCFWALAQWSGRRRQILWLKIFAGILFFVSSCTSLSLLAGSDAPAQFRAGGMTGYFMSALLGRAFGQAALIISCVLFVISLLLATELMMFPLLAAVFKALQSAGLSLYGRIKRDTSAVSASKKNGRGMSSKPVQIKIKRADQKRTEPKVEDNKKEEPKTDNFVKPVIKSFMNRRVEKQKTPKEAPAETAKPRPEWGNYKLPTLNLLEEPKMAEGTGNSDKMIEEQSRLLQDTLADFGIDAKVVEVEQGPVITRYELQPASGIKLQRITGLSDNIALAMQATSVRILAPIPGKARIGIEIPNPKKQIVRLKDVIVSDEFNAVAEKSKLAFVIGKDSAGNPMVADLDQMPHLLIAGSTGSGKTVCVNSIITSLLYRTTPHEVRFIMIDPKMVELVGYNGIPHLLTPVITQIDRVPNVLNWLINEMESRYKILSKYGVRQVESYNEKIESQRKKDEKNGKAEDANAPQNMPYIVVFIDELADLMMTQGKEVEHAITRLSQLARAVGIHMVLATQRPSVDVITGVIKANFQARIAFQVASKVDSRTVLDQNGADCLLGRGDLLYMDPAKPNIVRGQGAWVTDNEIESTVDACKNQQETDYSEEILKAESRAGQKGQQDFRGDEHFEEACRVIVASGVASVSLLQRRLGLGYTRAARLVDMMEEDGIVGPHRGSKAREVLVSLDTLEERLKSGGTQMQEAEESAVEEEDKVEEG